MSLCACTERPRCACSGCVSYADFSVWQPAWPGRRSVRLKFMCQQHLEWFISKTPIAGIDKPPGASDFWRPSLMEAIRHGDMEIRRQDRQGTPPEIAARASYRHQRDQRYTPAQLKSIERLRAGIRERREDRP